MSAARFGALVMAYGTPSSPDELEAYYTDIRRGRPPTPEQLADLRRRYDAIGGLSPLIERTRAQCDAIARDLADQATARTVPIPVSLGMKHAPPHIEDAVGTLANHGIEQVVGVVLAPHYSAFSVGEYHERARKATAAHGLNYAGIDSWHALKAYVSFTSAAVDREAVKLPDATKVVFTAHSLPQRILASGDRYPDELRSTAALVAKESGLRDEQWTVAYQSAGRTPEPWLGPELLSVIDDLAEDGTTRGVLVCACGFVADHLEVLYDLDIEASARARERGLAFARTACVNDDPDVMAALASLIASAAESIPT